MLIRPVRRQRGFNIIEILTAIVLLALLLVLGMPQYSIYMANNQIRSTAEGMLAGLQFARAEAISRNITEGVTFELNGTSWSVVLPVTATRPTAEILRSQPGGERMGQAQVAVVPAGTTALNFNGLGRLAAPTNGPVQLTVSNPTGGACTHADASAPMRCLRVVVTQSGQVRMCDPAKTSPDPQAC